MELLTPSIITPILIALYCVYLFYFFRAIRAHKLNRLRRFTAFTMILGAALPLLNILVMVFLTLELNLYLHSLLLLSPLPSGILSGYFKDLPFLFFIVSAVLLLHPKAPRYARQVELAWSVILLYNLVLAIIAASTLASIQPMTLPALWVIISSIALYKVIASRRKNTAATPPS